MDFQLLFPTAEDVLQLSPQQLGARMLPLLAKLEQSSGPGLDFSELQERIASDSLIAFPLANYPPHRRPDVRNAVWHAGQWLQLKGLVVERPLGAGGKRWQLSDEGRAFARAPDPLVAIKNGQIQLLSKPGVIVAELAEK